MTLRGKGEGERGRNSLDPHRVLEGCVCGPIPSVLVPLRDVYGLWCACSSVHRATGTERSPWPLVPKLPLAVCVLSSAQGVDEPFPSPRSSVSRAESVAVTWVSWPPRHCSPARSVTAVPQGGTLKVLLPARSWTHQSMNLIFPLQWSSFSPPTAWPHLVKEEGCRGSQVAVMLAF